MPDAITRPPGAAYICEGPGGSRYLIYNSLVMSTQPGHDSGRWYIQPIPVPPGDTPGKAHASAEGAERSLLRRSPQPGPPRGARG